ncbi:MAG: GNAT family N-acetyltransferase [Oscillospiraceae bacterium]|nr:GNAT family N-acetyltransferase [Oscillospiraceae bacterium]
MNLISEIKEQDLILLSQSYMRTFNGEPWLERWLCQDAFRRLENLYHTPDFYGLAFRKENTPIGAVFGRIEHFYDGDTFQIEEFWIEQTFQGMGYGSELIQKLKEMLSGTVKSMFLITMHNPKTIGFYQKNGFTVNEGFCVMHTDL